MKNVAVFISGRLLDFRSYLLPFLLDLKQKYNVKLFMSINTLSFSKDDDIEYIKKTLIEDLIMYDILGNIYFEEYKMPIDYVMNRINNNVSVFPYNSLSQYFNDSKCFELIEEYEKQNNINFDVVCKTRSDIVMVSINNEFILDDKDACILRNKHIQDIRYWGHIYNDTPLMVSDAFAYGNMKTMKLYCSTYQWILDNDKKLLGKYTNANEIYLTDSLLRNVFYNIPGGGHDPQLTSKEIIDKYENNEFGIKIVIDNNFHYNILSNEIRHKNNFIIDNNNVYNYSK